MTFLLSDRILGADYTEPSNIGILIGSFLGIIIAIWFIRNSVKKIITRFQDREDIWLLFEYMTILGEAGEEAEQLRRFLRLFKSKELAVGLLLDQ